MADLRKPEKAKWGNLWDWLKSKIEKYFFYIGGLRIVNIEHLQHIKRVFRQKYNNEEFQGLVPWGIVPLRSLKNITLAFQRCVILDA